MSHNFLLDSKGKNPGVVSMNLNDTWTGKSFLEIIGHQTQAQPHSRVTSLSLGNLSDVNIFFVFHLYNIYLATSKVDDPRLLFVK